MPRRRRHGHAVLGHPTFTTAIHAPQNKTHSLTRRLHKGPSQTRHNFPPKTTTATFTPPLGETPRGGGHIHRPTFHIPFKRKTLTPFCLSFSSANTERPPLSPTGGAFYGRGVPPQRKKTHAKLPLKIHREIFTCRKNSNTPTLSPGKNARKRNPHLLRNGGSHFGGPKKNTINP